MEAKVLTHCVQGLYYLLRHPDFMGRAARGRLGGCRQASRQAALIYRNPSGGNNTAVSLPASKAAPRPTCTLQKYYLGHIPHHLFQLSTHTHTHASCFGWTGGSLLLRLMRHQGELGNLDSGSGRPVCWDDRVSAKKALVCFPLLSRVASSIAGKWYAAKCIRLPPSGKINLPQQTSWLPPNPRASLPHRRQITF